MVSSQIRAQARQSLTGKWGKAAILMLVYAILTAIISFVGNLIPFIGSIAVLIISTPLSFGFIVSLMRLKNGEQVGATDFLETGFSSIGRVWGIIGYTVLKMIVPVILMVVTLILMTVSVTSGSAIFMVITTIAFWASWIYVIVKGLLYSLTYYILAENPNMNGKEIVDRSEQLMKGNRWRFIWLELSFIGWSILASFTFGIGLLWLTPYMSIAAIYFYEDLAQNN